MEINIKSLAIALVCVAQFRHGKQYRKPQQESKMFVQNTNRKQVIAQHPGAAKIVKVDGGYKVFMLVSDYTTWKNQK